MTDAVFQRCIHPHCGHTADLADTAFQCAKCGGLYDVAYDWNRLPVPASFKHFEAKWANRTDPLDFSGVGRFRRLVPFAPDDKVMTVGEGQTLCQRAAKAWDIDPEAVKWEDGAAHPAGMRRRGAVARRRRSAAGADAAPPAAKRPQA